MSQLAFDPNLAQATRQPVFGEGSVVGSAESTTTSRFEELSSEDFIRIIFTELSNQDPFEPNDSSALLEQLNSIRSIESDLQLQDRLENLVTQNQLASAGSLVGTFVSGLTADLARADGLVIGISRNGEQVNLDLDNGYQIPMNQLETVLDPQILAQQLAQQQYQQQLQNQLPPQVLEQLSQLSQTPPPVVVLGPTQPTGADESAPPAPGGGESADPIAASP